MAVAPDDEDEAYFLSATFNQSMDGGSTLTAAARGGGGGRWRGGARRRLRRTRRATGACVTAPGGDHHDIWIDPTNANRADRRARPGSVDHDQPRPDLVSPAPAESRRSTTSRSTTRSPTTCYGNKQDEPSYRGPSNSRLQAGFGGDPGIPRAMWHAVRRRRERLGDARSHDPNIIWSTASGSGSVGGIVVRFDERRAPVPQRRGLAATSPTGRPTSVEYRFVWDAPLAISPHDHNTIYVGSQHVHRTTNGGQSWEVISPDLTLNDKSRMRSSGGLTPDNIGVEYARRRLRHRRVAAGEAA